MMADSNYKCSNSGCRIVYHEADAFLVGIISDGSPDNYFAMRSFQPHSGPPTGNPFIFKEASVGKSYPVVDFCSSYRYLVVSVQLSSTYSGTLGFDVATNL